MRFLSGLDTKARRRNDAYGALDIRAIDRAIGGREGVTRRGAAGPFYATPGVPYNVDWDLDRVIRDGYERVIWVNRVVDARASNCIRCPLTVTNGPGPDAEELPDYPLLRLLNKRANLYETGKMFRYRLHTLLQLSKKGVFVEVIANKAGEIQMLQHLNPLYTWPLPDPANYVEGFEVRTPDGSLYRLPMYRPGETNGVLWVRRPHPTDPYSSTCWVESAGLSIDLDWYQRLYNRNFMQNDGRPGGLLAIKGEVEPEFAAELKRRLAPGPGNAGQVNIIEADEATWIDTSVSPRDAQYNEGRAVTKSEILIAGGTPLSVLGDASGRTFDNADAEEEVWWRSTLLPDLDLEASYYDMLTVEGWDDEVQVSYNTEGIYVLKREERQRQSSAQAEWDKGLITLDEYREQTGRDPIDVPGARVTWVPGSGKVPVGSEEDSQAVIASMGGGAPPPEEEVPEEETFAEEEAAQEAQFRREEANQEAADQVNNQFNGEVPSEEEVKALLERFARDRAKEREEVPAWGGLRL